MADHDEIDEAIDGIELLIRRGDLGRLREAACMLAELLDLHFVREERSPLFTTLTVERSSLAKTIEQLLREHGEMRVEIRALLDREDLAPALLALIARLDEHEKVEMALLGQLLTRQQ